MEMIIIGANSFIGKYLYEHFSKKMQVTGTYYKNPEQGLTYFDLENPNFAFLDNTKARYAVICSAISKIDDCKKFEEKAYKINVEGTKKLIEKLFEKNIIPVFFSSTYVFGNGEGNYKEDDIRNPETACGKHKKEIEDFLINSKKKFLIFRLGKVYGLRKGDGTLLTEMMENKDENKKYISDQTMSPIYVGDIVKIVESAIENNLLGVYNLASEDKINWYELAKKINEEFNLNRKITSCLTREFNFLEKRMLKNTINSEKIAKKLEFKFTSIEKSIGILKKAYKSV